MKRSIIILALTALLFCSCFLDPDPNGLPSIGMIAYYPFDGDVKDYTTTQNHCTNYGPSGYVEGVSGLAKDFNGLTDILELQYPLDAKNGLTASYWIKSQGVLAGQENGVVLCKYNKDSSGRYFIFSTQESYTVNYPSVRASFYPYANDSHYADGVYSNLMSAEDVPHSQDSSLFTFHNYITLSLNEWTHCVVNVSDFEIQVWINGVLTVSKIRQWDEYGVNNYNGANVPSYIGNCPALGYGDNNHFHGAIDEMRIYNRPLTEEEIIYIFQNTNPGKIQRNTNKIQNL